MVLTPFTQKCSVKFSLVLILILVALCNSAFGWPQHAEYLRQDLLRLPVDVKQLSIKRGRWMFAWNDNHVRDPIGIWVDTPFNSATGEVRQVGVLGQGRHVHFLRTIRDEPRGEIYIQIKTIDEGDEDRSEWATVAFDEDDANSMVAAHYWDWDEGVWIESFKADP